MTDTIHHHHIGKHDYEQPALVIDVDESLSGISIALEFIY